MASGIAKIPVPILPFKRCMIVSQFLWKHDLINHKISYGYDILQNFQLNCYEIQLTRLHVHYLLFWQVVQYHLNYHSILHLKEHLHVPMSVCQLNRKLPLVFVCRWATTADLQIHSNEQYHCNVNDNLIKDWGFIRIRPILLPHLV